MGWVDWNVLAINVSTNFSVPPRMGEFSHTEKPPPRGRLVLFWGAVIHRPAPETAARGSGRSLTKNSSYQRMKV